MRMPRIPPDPELIWEIARNNPEKFVHILKQCDSTLFNGRYRHWDKVRHLVPPTGLTCEEWWSGVKFKRRQLYQLVPLKDKETSAFRYALTDPIPGMLHEIDLGAGGFIQMPDQITNPETRDQYYVSSLIEEAITSSQLEGATTTRPIAKEMIRTGRPPRDRSEQMILNNYIAMRQIGKLKNEPFSKELILNLHRIVTDRALDDPSAAGRFRRADEDVRVEGYDGEVFHVPPDAETLERRMEEMCAFANGELPEHFVHPVIRSIILHFWLSYDHPFKDGNGRTARAMFYWSMLRHKYWLCEFISISQIIRKGPVKYGRAFLYTETDENDLTYFVLYHLETILRALRELHRYIQNKVAKLQKLEVELRGMMALNHRQRALISHALRHPNQRYTIESHRVSQNVVYQTARTDLLDLADRRLLEKHKLGKSWVFIPAKDLDNKLSTLGVAAIT